MTVTIASLIRAEKYARRELPPPARRRELRVKANLPQQWIADRLGVGRTAVSMYESGLREPRPGTKRRQQYLEILEALEELA